MNQKKNPPQIHKYFVTFVYIIHHTQTILVSASHSGRWKTTGPRWTRPVHSILSRKLVVIFGERILSGELQSRRPSNGSSELMIRKLHPPPPPGTVQVSHPPPSPSLSSLSFTSLPCNDNHVGHETLMIASIKRQEGELEEIKKEVMLLKDKASELEVVISSLDAEIQKKTSKVAEIEIVSSEGMEESGRHGRDVMSFDSYMPSLAHHVFSLGEIESHFEERRRKKEMIRMKKKKPIVPLVEDMFMLIKKKDKKEKSTGSSSLKQNHPSLHSPPFSGVLC